MSTIRIELDGVQELIAALEAVGRDAVTEIGAAVTKTALDVDRDIKKRIQGGKKTGTVYYRIPGSKYMTVRAGGPDGPPVAFIPGGGSHNLSAKHQASAPGQAPATDTGRLVNSIMFRQETPLMASVSSNAIYARRLEYGGGDRNGRFIKARPAWRPAVEKMRPKLAERIERALRDAMA